MSDDWERVRHIMQIIYRVTVAESAVDRVRALHAPDPDFPDQCTSCCVPEHDDYACGIAIPSPYPCKTIQALEKEQS